MAMPLQEVLEQRFGVDEADFAAALMEFAERAGPLALTDLRPRDEFADTPRATLRKLGATLAPLDADELGPVAGLAAAHAELVAHSLSVATVAERLGVDSSRVRQRIYARSLYAFKHRGAWRVPAFQLQGGALVPGLNTVVVALPSSLHPVAVSRWCTTPNPDLAVDEVWASPIDWLAGGGSPEPVAALAATVDER